MYFKDVNSAIKTLRTPITIYIYIYIYQTVMLSNNAEMFVKLVQVRSNSYLHALFRNMEMVS